MSALKILYVCNDLDYFKAHRLFLAKAMVAEKRDVVLATGGVESSKVKSGMGKIKLLSLDLDRHKLNLRSDLTLIKEFLGHLKTEKPDVVHAITIKPVLLMGVALMINKLLRRQTPKLVWTFPGLGKVFEPDRSAKSSIRKAIVSTLLRISNQVLKPHATFENYSSMEELAKAKIITRQRASVVMGAGLDRDLFYSAERSGELRVLFASRLLNAKGLGEYIEAAKSLKSEFPEVDFVVAGKQEAENPDAFSISDLNAAHEAGYINYIGSVDPDDMPEFLRQADIHVAPSKLQEGLPRVVLEAASCGCCVIASDHEMLRKFVFDGKTGWLLNEVTKETIVTVLRIALDDAQQTRKMGELIAKKAMSLPIYEDAIIAHFSNIYKT